MWIKVEDDLPKNLEKVAVVLQRKDGKRFVREMYRCYDDYDDLEWENTRFKNLGKPILWTRFPINP